MEDAGGFLSTPSARRATDLAILDAGNGGERVAARDKTSGLVVYAADRPRLACGAMENNVTWHDYLSHGFSFLC